MRRGERGASAGWLLSFVVVAVLCVIVALWSLLVVEAKHRAARAADLAALAGARAAVEGRDGCAVAARIAAANRARLAACAVSATAAVTVTTQAVLAVPRTSWLAGVEAVGEARAAPVR